MTFDLLYPLTARANRRNPWRATSRFDPAEPRRFGGVRAGALSVAARDQVEARAGRKTPGVAQRVAGYTAIFRKALEAYLCVKRALKVWERPLQEGCRPHQKALCYDKAERQRRHWFWRTPPPTKSEWAARTARYGFDVRATSPAYIKRAVYRKRAKMRALLAGPLTEAFVALDKTDFIGPPAPRDYKDPEDYLMVWPPVFIGDAGLPEGVSKEARESTPIDFLPSGKNPRPPARGKDDLCLSTHASVNFSSFEGEVDDPSHWWPTCEVPDISVGIFGMTEAQNKFKDPAIPRKRCADAGPRSYEALSSNLHAQYLWALQQYGDAGARAFTEALSREDQNILDAALSRKPP